VVIRLVEGDETTRTPFAARLANSLGIAGSLVTSLLTRLECRSKPLRIGDLDTLEKNDLFFVGVELILADITPVMIEWATELRARYNLKTPDALHYATAMQLRAKVFLTGDRCFARCLEVPVDVL